MLVICAATALLANAPLWAQDQDAPSHELYHTPPELRTAAAPLKLSVSTSPLKKGSYRLEALIIRDGQSFPATFDSIEKNNIGRNAYVFTLAAPKKVIRYKFFLRDGQNNTLAQSEEFTIARNCETDFHPQFIKPVDTREQVEQLATESLLLEAQLEQLHTIYRTAEELEEEVNGKK